MINGTSWQFVMRLAFSRSAKVDSPLMHAQVYLRTKFGVDRDLALLPHFVQYYRSHYVDHFLIILHARSADSSNLKRAHDLLGSFGLQAADVWITSDWSTGENARRHRELVGALPSDTWIISADSDEFHCFPVPLKSLIKALEDNGYDAVTGRLVDRVSRRWRLVPLCDDTNLFLQFPVEAEFYHRPPGNPGKVVLHRRAVLTAPGHHAILHPDGVKVYPHPISVAHFKWFYGVSRKYTDPKLIAHHSETWEYPIYQSVIDRNFSGVGRLVNIAIHTSIGRRIRRVVKDLRRKIKRHVRRVTASTPATL